MATRKNLSVLTLAALGIVYGDIGTSPLYALRTVVGLAGGKPSSESALGLLSLIIWTLLITVSFKYVTFVMRADNNGEGGILALMSLLGKQKHHRPAVAAIGLFGAALIYGDGALTPAISVLSALEGMEIASPAVAPYILPFSVAILLALFGVQFIGTARIGWIFGPVMTVWFIVIAALGISGVVRHPVVLAAFNPWYGLHYLFTAGATGFLVLGGVFLAVTGAEALYADMGHIGARPIRLAWYGLVLPSLLINYAGQTALLLSGYSVGDNTFYLLCPPSLLKPLIGIATLATIIASQAIITGVFSMTRQVIQLGWCPRLHVTQTSSESYGQIYVGVVNWLLALATISLAVSFGGSERLAGAYGIAVSFTMLLTTVLLYVAMREVWRWNLAPSLLVLGGFFCVDAAFLGANLLKVFEGGWAPLALAAGIYVVMKTWRRGATAVNDGMSSLTIPVDDFIRQITVAGVPRVAGSAVFLSKTTEETPPIIIWHVTHNRALHRHVVALSVVIGSSPSVAPEERLTVGKIAPDFWRIIAHYGYMESLDIPALLARAKELGCDLDLSDVTYYVGHETILHCPDGTGLPLWQEALFAFMQRNSAHISEYFRLPRNAVVEIGRQVEI